MTRETITLTPVLAKKLLESNYEGQRHMSKSYANTLARDISNDNWRDDLANNAIIISDTGKLLDGQHRCKAVMIANKPIRIEVVKDVPEEMFRWVDGGKSRLTSDFVNTKYKNTVAALGRFATCIKNGVPVTSSIQGKASISGKIIANATRSEILEEVNANTEFFVKLSEFGNTIRTAAYGGGTSAYAEALYLIAYAEDFENMDMITMFVEEFEKEYSEFEAINIGKKKIIRRLVEVKARRATAQNAWLVSMILLTYDKFINGGNFPSRTEFIVDRYNAIIKAKAQEVNK